VSSTTLDIAALDAMGSSFAAAVAHFRKHCAPMFTAQPRKAVSFELKA
jgi:hypothetical protein